MFSGTHSLCSCSKTNLKCNFIFNVTNKHWSCLLTSLALSIAGPNCYLVYFFMILPLRAPSPCEPLLRFAYPLSGLIALGPLALAQGSLSPLSARAGFDAWREHRDDLVRKAICDCMSTFFCPRLNWQSLNVQRPRMCAQHTYGRPSST